MPTSDYRKFSMIFSNTYTTKNNLWFRFIQFSSNSNWKVLKLIVNTLRELWILIEISKMRSFWIFLCSFNFIGCISFFVLFFLFSQFLFEWSFHILNLLFCMFHRSNHIISTSKTKVSEIDSSTSGSCLNKKFLKLIIFLSQFSNQFFLSTFINYSFINNLLCSISIS